MEMEDDEEDENDEEKWDFVKEDIFDLVYDANKSQNNPSDMDTLKDNDSFDEVPEYIVEAFSYHKDAIQAVRRNPMNKNQILTGGLDDILNLINTESG